MEVLFLTIVPRAVVVLEALWANTVARCNLVGFGNQWLLSVMSYS
jgi:hypothetical protein